MKKVLSMVMLAVAMLVSCTGEENVPYEVYDHYFVRNDAGDVSTRIFDNSADFDSVFGMGAVMGEGGQPKVIDFDKNVAVGVILPETDCPTEINPVSLKNENGKLELTYEAVVGPKASYTMRPSMVIVVDKKYQSEVSLTEVKKDK